ncbi:MAG TPA: phosphatase PAP2 family protein [Lacibacter sp.]|jgi:membrane-associated phospholipid phosphatase|nr:phosphatase PAP2 family protein [Lacibacter sp.]
MNWKYNHPIRNLFTYATILLLVVGVAALFYWNKEQIFIALNNQHSNFADLVLKYFTYVGDGIFMAALAVIMFLVGKRKLGLLLIFSFLLSGLLAQTIKRIEQRPRPGAYFQQPERIHRVDDKLLKGNNSFPSGHTTTAFATFSLLAFATRNRAVQLFFFAVAVVVAYSRIYVGAHFAEDVLAGAALGFISSYFLCWLLRKKEWD